MLGAPYTPLGGAQSPRQVPPRPLAVTRGCHSRAGDGREVPPWDGEALPEPFGVENGGGKRLAEQGRGVAAFGVQPPAVPQPGWVLRPTIGMSPSPSPQVSRRG